MSTQSTSTASRSTTVECKHPDCETVGRKWEFHHGKYCSNTCEIRHEGRKKLKEFKFDHKRCYTCFRPLKTVNPPKPDFEFTERGHGWTKDEDGNFHLEFYSQEVTRDAAVGYQFLTPHAGKGEKQRDGAVFTGTICEDCGNTSHTHHEGLLAGRRAIGRLVTLLLLDDDFDEDLDVHRLHSEYLDTRDLELAVGKAIGAGDTSEEDD